jgi:all-trans-retinol 13,14-reductase
MGGVAANYDAIVIGSGIGGMAVATRLSQKNRKVLVLEASDEFGGYTGPVVYGEYEFDFGIHYIGKLGIGDTFRVLLDELGLEDLAFIELDPEQIDHYIFPDYEFKFCKGKEAFAGRLISDFPGEENGIRHFLDTTEKVDLATTPDEMAKGGFGSWLQFLWRHPHMLRLSRQSFQSFLDSIIRDQQLKTVLSALLYDVAVGPRQVSAATAMAVWGYYLNGAYYPKGGSRGIRDAFVGKLSSNGANLKHSSAVVFLTKKNGNWMVRTEHGEQYSSRIVVSSIDPKITICSLLDRKLAPPGAYKKANYLQPSSSILSVYIGTDLDLIDMGFTTGNIAYFSDWDLTPLYDAWSGKSMPQMERGYFINSPSVRDPGAGLAPEGHHTLQILSGWSYESVGKWATMDDDAQREEYDLYKKEKCNQAIRLAERHVKGLSDHVSIVECITPLDCEKRVRAVRGGIYGPAHISSQMGPGRFQSLECGVEGLFLAGAGTFGAGLLFCAASGFYAAEKGLAYLEKLNRQ